MISGTTDRLARISLVVALAALAMLLPANASHASVPSGLDCDGGASPICVARVSDTIEFEAPFSQITVDPAVGSFVMTGDVTLRSPAGDLPLVESEIVFEPSPELETFGFEVYGHVMAPLPALPLFENAEITYEPRAAIGVVSRETLQQMFVENPLPLAENFREDGNGNLERDADGNPILREPGYVLFHYESSPQLELPLDELLLGTVGLTPGETNPFRFELPGRSLTFVLDPADPYFFYSPERSVVLEKKKQDSEEGRPVEEETLSDEELLALQDDTAAALDDMLASDQFAPADRRRFESARERLYRLDAAQLAGLSNDALASFTGKPSPDALSRMTDVRDGAADLDRRRHNRPLAADGSDPGLTDAAMDYAVPSLALDNRPADRNPDAGRGVDVRLRRLQDRTAAGLDAMLDADAFGELDRAQFEQARADIYRLDAAQLAGVSNEMLATYTGGVDEATVTRVASAMDDSSAMHRDRTGREPSDEDVDFRRPRIRDDRESGTDSDRDDSRSMLAELQEFGFSWNGGIPFAPETTWGLPDGAGEFKGHVYLKAQVPLATGITLSGPTVWHLGMDGIEVGGNGDVDVELGMGILSFGFPLGNASAGVAVTTEEQAAYFSGLYDPDLSWLPKEVPFTPANSGRLAGFLSATDPQDTRLMAQGSYGYDTAGLSALIGIQLDDIVLAEADMKIDPAGVFVRGTSSASIHPSLGTGAALQVETLFSTANPLASYLLMRGDITVAGVGVSPATVYAGGAGLLVSGSYVTPLSSIGLSGEITADGPSLTGTTEIVIPLGDITKAADDAEKAVSQARSDVEYLTVALADMRATVQAERDRDARNLSVAQSAVNKAQSSVNSLNSSISANYRNISTWNKQISSKYRWYKRQKWYNKSWAYGVYAGYKAYRKAKIAAAYVAIGALKASKVVAVAALDAAKLALSGIQAGMDLFPIDADPRVAGLIVSLETARFTLAQTEAVLGAIPVVNADLVGAIELTLDAAGMRGTLNASAGGQQLTSGRVTFGAQPMACISLAGIGEVCAPF